jgi:hypothetical protein
MNDVEKDIRADKEKESLTAKSSSKTIDCLWEEPLAMKNSILQ